MSIDLENQIRAYAEFLESTLPVDVVDQRPGIIRDSVSSWTEGDPGPRPASARLRNVGVMAAAAMVVAFVAVVAVLTRNGAESDVVTQPSNPAVTIDQSPRTPADTATTLSITWVETAGPDRGLDTVAGRLRVDPSGRLLRLTDGTDWVQVSELIGVTVGQDALASADASGDRVGFVLVSGTRERVEDDPFGLRREVVLLRSSDGVTWDDIDISALDRSDGVARCPDNCLAIATVISATYSNGLTVFGPPEWDQIVGTINGDRVTDVHEPAWSSQRCCSPVNYLEFAGEIVVRQQDPAATDSALAWCHLGGDMWSSPVSVPFASNIAKRGKHSADVRENRRRQLL